MPVRELLPQKLVLKSVVVDGSLGGKKEQVGHAPVLIGRRYGGVVV
jgi:hypothetical protein